MTNAYAVTTFAPDVEVPTYDVLELRPKSTHYCIVLFIINEGERVQSQLRKMVSLTESLDVIVGDGGSTDGSLEPEFLEDLDGHDPSLSADSREVGDQGIAHAIGCLLLRPVAYAGQRHHRERASDLGD